MLEILVHSYPGLVVIALTTVPLAVAALWTLTRWRRRHDVPAGTARRRSAVEVAMVWATLPLVAMTLVPGPDAGSTAGAVSLEPLRDLATMPPFQVAGNLAILAPVGLLAPLRFPALASIGRITVLAATGSALIEVAQYALRLDRVSSVDDVLLNTAGAVLAALVSRPCWSGRKPGGSTARAAQSGRSTIPATRSRYWSRS
ncbi:VanZ family protein [Nocardioides caeni]|uniref:VanZ family protein n=1 Tax=Nocardioides caeni TaxID=574700 RepID=A0A4S8N4T4_9ACTN|nr:VanZ family protein [Nocardioides caeni]